MPGSRSTASSRPASRPASLYKTERTTSTSDNSHSRRSSENDNRASSGSSRQSSRRSSRHSRHSRHSRGSREGEGDAGDSDADHDGALAVPVETLVEHLLAARRALGTIGQVLRGNELATEARALYTDAAVDAAHTAFVRRGMRAQVDVLLQIRRGMAHAYDRGRRDFRTLIRTLDSANGQLEHTMEILRATTVAAVFRPPGEAPRNLLDFVDEAGVEALRDAIKQSIGELQAAQTSFDGDLLRFDTDLRTLNKAMTAAPPPPPPLPIGPDLPPDSAHGDADPQRPFSNVPHLLASLTLRSHTMAENLASLTRHFDLCVTAVRTTEGGLALARWKAANSGHSGSASKSGNEDPVSISGVIAEQDSAGRGGSSSSIGHLEPLSAQERAEMMQVVLQDAAEVDDVVADIGAELHAAEAEFAAVHAHAEQAQAACAATTAAFRVLEDIGARLPSYAAAEAEFAARWANERAVVAERLADMDGLRAFYEGYAHAYDTLILEAERRRTVEARIQTVWRKARDAVERLVEADRAERASFRQEVGEFLPTDLWLGMDRLPRGAELVASLQLADGQRAGPAPPAAPAPGGAAGDSLLDEPGHAEPGNADPSGSHGVGGSSTRTVVGR